jgi:hypothetical protein
VRRIVGLAVGWVGIVVVTAGMVIALPALVVIPVGVCVLSLAMRLCPPRNRRTAAQVGDDVLEMFARHEAMQRHPSSRMIVPATWQESNRARFDVWLARRDRGQP